VTRPREPDRAPTGSRPPGGADEPARALAEAGQAHLVAHAASLGDGGAAFLRHAARWPWVRLRELALAGASSATRELRPPQCLTLRRLAGEGALGPRLARLGEGLLAHGRVATLLLAGGQGTRLGFSGPKGCVSFGPEPERTLYRIHAERVLAARRRTGRALPFHVLVSRATEAATREAFADLGVAGLDDVVFLVQGEMPCLSRDGRGLLAGPGNLALGPDGHGGALPALRDAGALDALVEAGVDVITTVQVDNPLALPFDPVTLGWMLERKAQVVTKVVRRRDATERVGLLARDLEGRHRIVEYSEADPATTAELVYGSIASHALSTRWLRDLMASGWEGPLHRALKRVEHLPLPGEEGAAPPDGLVRPAEPNAWKFERFLFDAFPEATRVEGHEVERAREFAPVKNARGEDSLLTSRMLVEQEVRRLARERGLPEPETPSLRPLEQG